MVTLAQMKERCGCAFFESRYQAYTEMMYYFGFFVVVSLIMCICAFATYDTSMGLAGRQLPPPEAWQFPCQQINTALSTVGYSEIFEAAISLMVTLTISSIMRSKNWAVFGLISIILFLILLIVKLVLAILTAVWLWSNNTMHCKTQTPDLYEHATAYFVAYDIIFVFQVLFGSAFMICCGLRDAVHEGLHHVSGDPYDNDNDGV